MNHEAATPAERLAALLSGERIDDQHGPDDELLARIHSHLPALEATLALCDDQRAEDLIYRFWHHSFKVYALQNLTDRIVQDLRHVGADLELHPWFQAIADAGTGKTFDLSHNKDWLTHTKPIVDAYFYARHMLDMVVKYGRRLEHAPRLLPAGWATVLELYQIR